MQREHKVQKKPFPIMQLTPDAYERPADSQTDKKAQADYIEALYQGKPAVYEFKTATDKAEYDEQIEILCKQLAVLAKEYKIPPELIKVTTEFPEHLSMMPAASTPFRYIKEKLEEFIFLVQKKIVVTKESVLQKFAAKFNDAKFTLPTEELTRQVRVEQDQARKFEAKKVPTLTMVLKNMKMCNTGIPVYLDAAVRALSGGNTILDAWCDRRSHFGGEFAEKHKALFPQIEEKNNAGTHVDVVLCGHAYQQGWGLRSEFNFRDQFESLTFITAVTILMYENDFHAFWNLRLQTKLFVEKFDELFWSTYKYKNSETKTTDWIPYSAEIAACVESDILMPAKIGIPAGELFERKELEVKDMAAASQTGFADEMVRFSPQLLRQRFLQYCAEGHYVDENEWGAVEGVFQNQQPDESIHLMQARARAFADLAWIEKRTQVATNVLGPDKKQVVDTIVSTDVTLMLFADLSQTNKTAYHIWSQVNFGVPDRCCFVQSASDFLKLMTVESDWIAFAKQLQAQAQFERHEVLLKTLLRDYPQHLATILNAMISSPEHVKKILEIVEADFQWTFARAVEAESKSNQSPIENLLLNARSRQFKDLVFMLRAREHDCVDKMAKFPSRYRDRARHLPIYSQLLNKADEKATPEDQFVYKMHLRRHFPVAFRKLKTVAEPDYVKEFFAQHERINLGLNLMQRKLYLAVANGDVATLEIEDVELRNFLPWIFAVQYDIDANVLAFLYQLAKKDCAEDMSPDNTPLLNWAIFFKQTKEVESMLAAKVDANQRNRHGESALHAAALTGDLMTARLLVAANSECVHAKAKNNTPVLFQSCLSGHLEMTDFLLTQGAKVDATDDRNTALFYAVANADLALARLLLERDAAINTPRGVFKPFIHAAHLGQAVMVDLFLTFGANVNVCDEAGQTALHAAAAAGHYFLVKTLLKAGANPTLTFNGKTPAQVANTADIRHLLLAAEFKGSVSEDTVIFAHHRLVQPEPAVFRDGAWQAYILNDEDEIVSFEKLTDGEKIRYYVLSMLQCNFPDPFRFSRTKATFMNCFADENALELLARELDKQDQLDLHVSLLQTIFREHAEKLVSMLMVMRPETVLKVFDCIDLDFHYLHPNSECHTQATNVIAAFQVREDSEKRLLRDAVLAHVKSVKLMHREFERENKSDNAVVGVQYSELVAHAKLAKPLQQPLYKMFLKIYYPKEFAEHADEAKPNYAEIFAAAHTLHTKFLEERDAKIYSAVRDGDLNTLHALGAKMADLIQSGGLSLIYQQKALYAYFAELTPLQEGVYDEQVILLDQGAKLFSLLSKHEVPLGKATTVLRSSPLPNAATCGRHELMKMLFSNGANPDAAISLSRSRALDSAIRNVHRTCVMMLLEQDAEVNYAAKNGATPLGMATESGMLDVAMMLLQQGANVNFVTNSSLNPLLIAVSKRRLEFARLYLSHGAWTNVVNHAGETPLYRAVFQGDIKMTQLLLESNADVNAFSRPGMTALHLAASQGNVAMVYLLLKAGADPTLVTTQNKLPADLTVDPDLKRYLLNVAANIVPAEAKPVFKDHHFLYHRLPSGAQFVVIKEKKTDQQVLLGEMKDDKEKLRYHIYSMLKSDFPDCHHLLSPSPTADEVFKTPLAMKELALALETDDLEKHESFLKSLFRNQAELFARLMMSMKYSGSAMKMLELVEMDFYFIHPASELHAQANAVKAVLMTDSAYKAVFSNYEKELAKLLPEFHLRIMPDDRKIPVPYSALVQRAEQPESKDQPIYKTYLRRYFPVVYRETCADEKPDFIRAFTAAHTKRFAGIPQNMHAMMMSVCDGKVFGALQMNYGSILQMPAGRDILHSFANERVMESFYQQVATESVLGGPLAFNATLFYWAVVFNQLKICQAEMKEVNFNQASNDGYTPLHEAASIGRVDIARLLLDGGAVLEMTGNQRQLAAIHFAAIYGHVEMMRLLLERGADIDCADALTRTPLAFAVSGHHTSVVRLLCLNNVNVNVYANNDITVLCLAAGAGYADIVKHLLDAGADPTLGKQKPFDVASTTQIKRLILSAELEREIKKAGEAKAPEFDALRQFQSAGTMQTVQAAKELLGILQGRNVASLQKPELMQALAKAPWKRFYEATQAMSVDLVASVSCARNV